MTVTFLRVRSIEEIKRQKVEYRNSSGRAPDHFNLSVTENSIRGGPNRGRDSFFNLNFSFKCML